MSEQLKTLKQLCIVNDSFLVVDVGVFENTLEKLFTEHCDFAGLTSSIENTYHLQSYFLNFNENAIHHIIEFFKSSGIPMNHDQSISSYELKLTMHMLKTGCICYSVVSNNEIALNTTCYKWKQILKNIGIIKRQHILKQYGKQSISDYDLAFIAKVYASTNLQFIEYLDNHNIKYY
jgi:lipopolysaccharide biosynthesis protein